jgi:hypothetical protein
MSFPFCRKALILLWKYSFIIVLFCPGYYSIITQTRWIRHRSLIFTHLEDGKLYVEDLGGGFILRSIFVLGADHHTEVYACALSLFVHRERAGASSLLFHLMWALILKDQNHIVITPFNLNLFL